MNFFKNKDFPFLDSILSQLYKMDLLYPIPFDDIILTKKTLFEKTLLLEKLADENLISVTYSYTLKKDGSKIINYNNPHYNITHYGYSLLKKSRKKPYTRYHNKESTKKIIRKIINAIPIAVAISSAFMAAYQIKESRIAFESQSRSYLTADIGKINFDGASYSIPIFITNSGTTPAYDVKVCFKYAGVPLNSIHHINEPERCIRETNALTIGKTSIDFSLFVPVENPEQPFYIEGEIFYRDIFNIQHFYKTHFKYEPMIQQTMYYSTVNW
jgi:hypothetical protein